MELKIYSPTEDGFIKAIEWNHEEIKKEVAEKVSYYANLVYSDNQIKEAKADRAKLNKFVQALEAKRKEVKKQCLAPYEDFERKIKEIVEIVNEPIRMIDSQVNEYAESCKTAKRNSICEYWNTLEVPEWLKLQAVFDQKWLNASVSLKSVFGAIDILLECIEKDLATLSNLPEFGFESTEVYKTTLDINKAIQEGHRLSEIQKRKAEHEAEQARLAAEAEAKKQDEESAPVSPMGQAIESIERQAFENCMNPPVEEKEWISFKALLTVDDAKALKEFFDSRRIEFEAI